MLALMLGLLVSSSSGCCLFDKLFGHGACGACCGKTGPYPGSCGPTGCGPAPCADGCCSTAGGPHDGADDGSAYAGPPSGATSYPYYTTRGPRDFFASNPRPIGPN